MTLNGRCAFYCIIRLFFWAHHTNMNEDKPILSACSASLRLRFLAMRFIQIIKSFLERRHQTIVGWFETAILRCFWALYLWKWNVFRFRQVYHVTWRPPSIVTARRPTRQLASLYLILQQNSTQHFSMVVPLYSMMSHCCILLLMFSVWLVYVCATLLSSQTVVLRRYLLSGCVWLFEVFSIVVISRLIMIIIQWN